MRNSEITEAIKRLAPGAQFGVSGHTLAGISWDDSNEQPRPTDAEILAEINKQELIDARTAAIERIKTSHEQELQSIKKQYPQLEIDGWHELAKDAENGSGECIERYANKLGVTVPEACTRVNTARQQYRLAYGDATGILTRLRDQINQENITIEELNDIKWQ